MTKAELPKDRSKDEVVLKIRHSFFVHVKEHERGDVEQEAECFPRSPIVCCNCLVALPCENPLEIVFLVSCSEYHRILGR